MPFRPDRMRDLRKQLGFTQRALADKLGTSYQLVQQYERGRNKQKRKVEPGAARLGDIADLLKTTADYLLGRTDDPRPLTPQEQSWLAKLRSGEVADFNAAANDLRKKMLDNDPKKNRVSRKKPSAAK